jgi:hypothetical protein
MNIFTDGIINQKIGLMVTAQKETAERIEKEREENKNV